MKYIFVSLHNFVGSLFFTNHNTTLTLTAANASLCILNTECMRQRSCSRPPRRPTAPRGGGGGRRGGPARKALCGVKGDEKYNRYTKSYDKEKKRSLFYFILKK